MKNDIMKKPEARALRSPGPWFGSVDGEDDLGRPACGEAFQLPATGDRIIPSLGQVAENDLPTSVGVLYAPGGALHTDAGSSASITKLNRHCDCRHGRTSLWFSCSPNNSEEQGILAYFGVFVKRKT